jgi:hypothetical protein
MLFWRVSESVGHFLEAATAANSDSDEDAVEPKKQKVSKNKEAAKKSASSAAVNLSKVPQLVLACAHLHNFIVDHSAYQVPTALVWQDSAPGKKALPISDRAQVAPPEVKKILNELPGRENITTKISSANTRQFVCDSVSEKCLSRPSHSQTPQHREFRRR